MLNEATKKNLRRKSEYIDQVQLHNGVPLWSWVDLNLTEICNRGHGHPNACTFCPRNDPAFYPNQNLYMSMRTASVLAGQLLAIGYQGSVVLCGYGEPLLHPKVVEIAKVFELNRVELVTNGDFLGPQKLEDLINAGVDHFVVSLYDGPEQVDKFKRLFDKAEWAQYTLRDRWHSAEDQFGLKLTNRGGTVDVGPQDKVDQHHPCYYLTYQMQVDWNGDVLLCPQDWYKKLKFGNVHTETLYQIWSSGRMSKRRRQLMDGRRVEHPCSACNTDGTLHGFNHAPAWRGVK